MKPVVPKPAINAAPSRRPALALAALAAILAVALLAPETHAQGWWPWANPDAQRPPPRPPAPIPQQLPPPGGTVIPGQPLPGQPGGPFGRAPSQGGGNVCLQLEQRLVAEGQQNRTVNPREQMQRIDLEIRQTERQLQQAQLQLDRGECFEYFLFSKSLRNTPQCRGASATVDQLRRRMGELDQQRSALAGAGERRVTDDIVRELARNGCGAQYVQEARRLDQSQSNPFWATEEDNAPRTGGNQFGSLPFATYRTICVRLCDGFFFPVSFSTLPNHFQRDAEICQQKCAAPVELYFHQNPGANVDQAVSVKSNQNYTALKSAFRYRKEFVHGCSCKEAEYQQGAGERRADAAQPATAAGAAAAAKKP